MSFDTAKLFFRHQQAGAYPALPLIAWVPALYIKANPFDNGESRFDHIGVGVTLISLMDIGEERTVTLAAFRNVLLAR